VTCRFVIVALLVGAFLISIQPQIILQCVWYLVQSFDSLVRRENVSFLPTGLLLLEDEVPYTLGGRPRFTVDRVGPGQHRVVQYPIRSDARGRYRIGPLRLRLADPFGLVELTRSFTAVDILTVVPAVHPLPPIKLGGA